MTQVTRPPPRPSETPPGARPTLPPGQPFSWKAWMFLGLLLGGMAIWQSMMNQEQAYPSIDYSEFYRLVEAGKVESVTLKGESVVGQLKQQETREGIPFQNFQSLRPDPDPELLPALRKHDVNINV